MARVRATFEFEYDVSDNLDERESAYGTRNLVQACMVDEANDPFDFMALIGCGEVDGEIVNFKIMPVIPPGRCVDNL